jgi:hypothetical protein
MNSIENIVLRWSRRGENFNGDEFARKYPHLKFLRSTSHSLKDPTRTIKAASDAPVLKEVDYSQFRKYTIEGSACAARNAQDNPLVLSRPAHLVVVDVAADVLVVFLRARGMGLAAFAWQ